MHFDRHVAYAARHRGDHPYMTAGARTISWAELDRQAGAIAAHLLASGLVPGDRFGVLLRNCTEWCVGFAAAIRAGAIMVPLNALFGGYELEQIARSADCAAILSRPSEIAKLGIVDTAADDRIALYDLRTDKSPIGFETLIDSDRIAPHSERPDTDILAICYTSGTTGLPKGIALSHRAVDTMVSRTGMRLGWEWGEERLLVLAPLAFTGGIITSLAVQFALGASGWLEAQVDPARALTLLANHRITLMAGVPALWERIAAAPQFADADLSGLSSAITGGAPVSMDLMRRFAAKGVIIRQQFGVSEHCGGAFCPDRAGALARPHSCGPALPGVEAELRDDNGRVVPHGTVGEIWLRSEQLMSGYWGDPEATAAAMKDGWYGTGDLAFFDEHGGLVVADRKKNMLISGGVNIYPAEIERAMMQIDGIVEVAVFGLDSEAWGQEVAAICHAPSLDRDTILAHARALLGTLKAPKHIALSPDRLPRTASDKIVRTHLRESFDCLRK